jgi:hypothetical protein
MMQKGRQSSFRGERRCKYTHSLSSEANDKHIGRATRGGGWACRARSGGGTSSEGERREEAVRRAEAEVEEAQEGGGAYPARSSA